MNKFKRTGVVFSWACILLTACHSNTAGDEKTAGVDKKDTAAAAQEWTWLSVPGHVSWHTYGKDSLTPAWKLEDSTLHLDASVPDGWQTKNGGDIVSNEEYADFDLQLEWKIAEGGNSGIMFHVKEDTSKYDYPWETGPEMQVADNEKNEDGKIVKSRAGELYELMAISKDVIKPAGQWNQVEIICQKGRLDFNINGEHVLSTSIWDDQWKNMIAGTKFSTMKDFGTFRKGRIALQDHGADVWFRNIRIKNL